MTTPRHSSGYPPAMLDALTHALNEGQLIIPSDNPHFDRLYFYGLFSALRREGRGELPDALSVVIAEKTVIVRKKNFSKLAQSIQKAIAEKGTILPISPEEDSIDRLFKD